MLAFGSYDYNIRGYIKYKQEFRSGTLISKRFTSHNCLIIKFFVHWRLGLEKKFLGIREADEDEAHHLRMSVKNIFGSFETLSNYVWSWNKLQYCSGYYY